MCVEWVEVRWFASERATDWKGGRDDDDDGYGFKKQAGMS